MEKQQRLTTFSLFLFDVDHFKHFNDTNGHLAGDDLLRDLARLLQSCVREGEMIGRYGGEEFLMVLPGVTGEDGLLAAERIRRAIQEHVFDHEKNQPLGDVTVSGGVATWPIHGRTAAEVLQHADEALYAAKGEGRNRVHLYDALADAEGTASPEDEKPDVDDFF
jgi:diguanylate cyclase (GGDEF)-like protein